MPTRMRAAAALVPLALAALACAGLSAQAQDPLQKQLETLGRESAHLQAMLKRAEQENCLLCFAFTDVKLPPQEGLDSAIRDLDQWALGKPLGARALVALPRELLADQLAARTEAGDLRAGQAAKLAEEQRLLSLRAVSAAKRRLEYLAARREELSPSKQSAGRWRIKAGYPKVVYEKHGSDTWIVECDVSPEAVSLHSLNIRGGSEAAIHDYRFAVRYPGLDRKTLEAGQEFTFALDGVYAYGKDNDWFTGVNVMLTPGDGAAVVKAEPLREGKSAAESAGLWLGRFRGGSNDLKDRREITLKAPQSGREFSYQITLGSFGPAIAWVFECVKQ